MYLFIYNPSHYKYRLTYTTCYMSKHLCHTIPFHKIAMYSSSSSGRSYRRNHHEYYDVANMTHCNCKPFPYPLIERVSWTPTNPGRRFRKCPRSACGVYGFLDPELPSQYYMDLFYKEHKEKEALMDGQGVVENSEDSVKIIGMLQREIMELKSKSKSHEAGMLLLVVLFIIICIMFVMLG